MPSLLDEPELSSYTPYSEAEYSFAPLYDGNYTRYDYDCSFADRYTLLPPLGARARSDSDQSVQDKVGVHLMLLLRITRIYKVYYPVFRI